MNDLERAKELAENAGVPAGAQRSGSGGERSRSEMSEISALDGSEGYGACGDDEVDPGEGAMLARDFGLTGAQEPEERDLEIIEGEILFYKRQAGASLIEIGKRLNEAKAQLSHGEWLPWLRDKVDISERSAQDFMRIAREYAKSAEIADLGASKALALLALSPGEREEFAAEKHTVDGVEKSVAEMTGAELKQAIRERDEARLAAEQAKAAAAAAAESQTKMEQDMRQLRELTERSREAEEEKARALAAAEEELKALREKPVDVAVEYKTDPAELEKAVAEAKATAAAELRAQQEKKEAGVKKLQEELKAAQEKAKAAELNLKRAEQEAAEAKTDAERARKAAQLQANGDMAAFKVLFEQAQDIVNRMAAAAEKAAAEDRAKMYKALDALSDAIKAVSNAE